LSGSENVTIKRDQKTRECQLEKPINLQNKRKKHGERNCKS